MVSFVFLVFAVIWFDITYLLLVCELCFCFGLVSTLRDVV